MINGNTLMKCANQNTPNSDGLVTSFRTLYLHAPDCLGTSTLLKLDA